MKQVLIIHGGESFSSYESYLDSLRSSSIDYNSLLLQSSWKSWLVEQMTNTDVLLPRFPNSDNAVYGEWKIYFEKLLPFLENNVQLIGHSLGAMFLAKYLQASPLKIKVKRLILIAGIYDDPASDSGSFLVGNATRLEKSAEEIHLFHSKDDPIVRYAELIKYQRDIPTAIIHSFDDRGHFVNETFPEILKLLQEK